jgi:CheY-like chemotaxis protein
VLLGDPTKLSQIFINLINNALKFTKNGEVKVAVKLIETGDDYSRINFAISDTGIGIPKDKQETIFESFSQGSIEINRKYGGTGLGLTIVKKIVDLLGGDINLTSEVGLGTTFDFELNLLHGTKEILVEKEKLYSDDILVGKKILVVEDNKINQMVTKKMLEKKEIKCQIIDSGEEAVEVLSKENDFDLVLMDVHLPGINGTIATQKIREYDTKKPIIALTAISLNENREMLLSFGMTDVITKPFEPENFYRIIAANLS